MARHVTIEFEAAPALPDVIARLQRLKAYMDKHGCTLQQAMRDAGLSEADRAAAREYRQLFDSIMEADANAKAAEQQRKSKLKDKLDFGEQVYEMLLADVIERNCTSHGIFIDPESIRRRDRAEAFATKAGVSFTEALRQVDSMQLGKINTTPSIGVDAGSVELAEKAVALQESEGITFAEALERISNG